jgi:hypothetical protein
LDRLHRSLHANPLAEMAPASADDRVDAPLMGPSCVMRPSWYLLLLLPFILFLISLYIRPAINVDSGWGFLALRSMLEGGPFNYVIVPDPNDIASDIATFQSWWSPGQYLVPGALIRLGMDYELAVSLTALVSIVIGVIGWAQVARSFAVTPFVTVVFLCGLVAFRYGTFPFQMYQGGEVLLFAAAPWCLYWLRQAIDRRPIACFAISLLCVTLLFIAKLTGLVVFAANVLAISLLELTRQRRVTSSMLALWAASGFGAIFFLVFWHAHGGVPANGTEFAVTLLAIWYPVAAAAFSGVSGVELLDFLYHQRSAPILLELATKAYFLAPFGLILIFWISYRLRHTRYLVRIIGLFAIVALFAIALAGMYLRRGSISIEQHHLRDAGIAVVGLFGLLLMVWVWYRLRNTRHRLMAVYLFAIIGFYTAALVAMYVWKAGVSFEERHLRYAGILFFLLFLVALDQWPKLAARSLTLIIFGVFAAYSPTSYAVDAWALMRGGFYDSLSFTVLPMVPPGALEYLRSEMAAYNWQRAIAVIPSPEAAFGLPPPFRIIAPADLNLFPVEKIPGFRWTGRAEKIFVIVQEGMIENGKADALLKCFVNYDQAKWSQVRIGGMIIYSQ